MSANRPTNHELIGRMYDAYNDRDLEALTALVGEDVDWPDGDERLHGRAAVRNYWSRQWARIHTQDKCRAASKAATPIPALSIAYPRTLFATQHLNPQQNLCFAAPYMRQNDTET